MSRNCIIRPEPKENMNYISHIGFAWMKSYLIVMSCIISSEPYILRREVCLHIGNVWYIVYSGETLSAIKERERLKRESKEILRYLSFRYSNPQRFEILSILVGFLYNNPVILFSSYFGPIKSHFYQELQINEVMFSNPATNVYYVSLSASSLLDME